MSEPPRWRYTETDPVKIDEDATLLEAGVATALAARDMKAVVGLIMMLVTVDAQRASSVYDTLQLGIELNRRGRLRTGK